MQLACSSPAPSVTVHPAGPSIGPLPILLSPPPRRAPPTSRRAGKWGQTRQRSARVSRRRPSRRWGADRQEGPPPEPSRALHDASLQGKEDGEEALWFLGEGRLSIGWSEQSQQVWECRRCPWLFGMCPGEVRAGGSGLRKTWLGLWALDRLISYERCTHGPSGLLFLENG